MSLHGRTFIARHGETIFNAAARMQGNDAHTPLTRAGFVQADAMGAALNKWLGTRQSLTLWSSDAGRTLQTLSIMAEHIDADWHDTNIDARLREIDIGQWVGRSYADIESEIGPFVDMEAGLFTITSPEGEDYEAVATRLKDWIADDRHDHNDRLVITHGMTARVLRGLLLDLPIDERFGVPIAPKIPQGSLVMVGAGEEKVIYLPSAGKKLPQQVVA